jgi:hypothetical protein
MGTIREQYGTREDEALRPLLAEPLPHACPAEYRREQLRSSLRIEALLESILHELIRSGPPKKVR